MGTTITEISRWFDEGIAAGNQYLLVVVDTFDYQSFPVYAANPAQCIETYKRYQDEGKMSRVMEIYDLTKDKFGQLAQVRAFALPTMSEDEENDL